MEQGQAKKIIEALLISSDKPLSSTEIANVLEELDAGAVSKLIDDLRNEYSSSGRSFTIIEIAGGYQLATEPAYADWLKKMYTQARAEKLSRPALETLAIIAYRQPITRMEIEDVRGVNIDGVLKKLLEKQLVRISGRKQLPGRPFCYGTTQQFLELFGLNSIENLPKLEEFGELMKAGDANVKIEDIAQENRPDRQQDTATAE
ncbi:MAG: SMC-Scp complex subunit ScpB [Candidatus Omnitrophica bacterium]|nr:SMC-Scp complex subunit ScpB [Candidatus Omnitrophota bacterium]